MTGLVALPLLVLFILYADARMFGLLVTLVALLALVEFFGMTFAGERKAERVLAAGGGTLLVPLAGTGDFPLFLAGVTLLFLFFAMLFLFRFGNLQTVMSRLGLLLLGFLYVSVLLSHIVLLRDLPFGREWVLLILLIVMAGDTGAYFTGISFGRRKLYPAISPNKSIEGAIGGLAGSVAGAFLAKWLFFQALSPADSLVLGLLIGTFGQIGDLFESMLKRSCGVKDSGRIIPGHGGILDRLDSLLFAFPLAFYYAFWIF
jgi:phosphatidate cytidylyltransferase